MITVQPLTVPQVDEEVKHLLLAETEKCTIVHCKYFAAEPTCIRIWQSTFLVEDTGHRKQLLQAYNISLMPEWMYCPVVDGFIRFTLVFEGLSKQCSSCHLFEEIPEPGGFTSPVMWRNTTDVYNTELL